MLKTVAYVSTAKKPPSEAELLQLAYRAQRYNTDVSVTGLLIYDGGQFMQVIEGSTLAVADVFGRIIRDPLHHNIRVYVDETIDEHVYADWAMLNTVEHSTATVEKILQFALDKTPTRFTVGQIEAMRRILDRLR